MIRAYLVLVGTEAEVLDGLAGVLGAAEQEGVGTSGLLKGQLVEGDDLAAGRGDAGTGGGGDPESGNRHLGNGQEAVVIRDSADDDDRLVLVAVLEVGRNAGQRDGRTVDTAHEQAAEDHLVEGRIGAAWQACCQNHFDYRKNRGFKMHLRARKR